MSKNRMCENGVLVLRNDQRTLGCLLHAPRGPFIAPRQLGVVGGNFGRLILPSVGWRTGQSGAPPNMHCCMSGADLLPNLAQPIVATLASIGAPDTVRCTPDSLVPLLIVGAGHVSPSDHATDRCEVDRWLTGQSGASPDSPVNFTRTPLNFSRERRLLRGRPTGQSGAPPDSPVNYSRTPPSSPESGLFTLGPSGAPDTVRCTTGQSGAPRLSSSWLYTANTFPIYIFLFLALRHKTLVPKSMY
jgi:hypothetical protein